MDWKVIEMFLKDRQKTRGVIGNGNLDRERRSGQLLKDESYDERKTEGISGKNGKNI